MRLLEEKYSFPKSKKIFCIFCKNNCSDPAAGAADDWYKGVLGSRFAFTMELRDTGL